MSLAVRRLLPGLKRRSACVARLVRASLLGVAILGAGAADVRADEAAPPFLEFVRNHGAALRATDGEPQDAAAWETRRQQLQTALRAAWGTPVDPPPPLDAQKHGELAGDGFRVERVSFQTLPGVRMLANAYVPDRPGRLPAVLCVHGHWPKAKQDPTVQARCIGLAKLGFFVLAVDAFGAGERAIGKALGEYHGAMTGALLFPIGRPLSGVQVDENRRAVDYLLTRDEVDPRRIGVTGASGGGNQSMYAGAFEERFAAAVPVCSVGNYQAYLGAACCMCEVVPGALRFTEEGDLLGLTAPRGLMVINATRDAPQFSVAEARKSLARTAGIYRLLDRPEAVRHTIIESAHDYNRPMREAMYGWMTRHLKGEGDGGPISEPEFKTFDPEQLRCYPGDSRPDDYVTLPKFAAAEARRLVAARRPAADARSAAESRERLAGLLGLAAATRPPLDLEISTADGARRLRFTSEPGVRLTVRQTPAAVKPSRLAIVLDRGGAAAAAAGPTARDLEAAGWTVATLDLRATGAQAVPGDAIGDAPDHNSAEWSLWIGRPLLGQWTHDVRRTLDAFAAADGGLPDELAVVGVGPAGFVAIAAAAFDERIRRTACVDMLATFVSETPYKGQALGVLVPGLLRDVGDAAHLAALVGERQVDVAGGRLGDGSTLDESRLKAIYAEAKNVRTTGGRPLPEIWKTSK